MGFIKNNTSGMDNVRRDVKKDAKAVKKETGKKVPRHEQAREVLRRQTGNPNF